MITQIPASQIAFAAHWRKSTPPHSSLRAFSTCSTCEDGELRHDHGESCLLYARVEALVCGALSPRQVAPGSMEPGSATLDGRLRLQAESRNPLQQTRTRPMSANLRSCESGTISGIDCTNGSDTSNRRSKRLTGAKDGSSRRLMSTASVIALTFSSPRKDGSALSWGCTPIWMTVSHFMEAKRSSGSGCRLSSPSLPSICPQHNIMSKIITQTADTTLCGKEPADFQMCIEKTTQIEQQPNVKRQL